MPSSLLAPLVSVAIAVPAFCGAPPASQPDPFDVAKAMALPDVLSAELEAAKAEKLAEKKREEWLHAPRSMPSYYQTDARWSGVPYAGASIGMSGCGLTAAAMSFEWWLRERYTPADLEDDVGNSCTTGGLNDMAKFGRHAESLGLTVSKRFHSISDACDEALSGKTVWASVSGAFGDSWYGGHIVLIWSQDGDIRVQDPASKGNTRAWSREELARAKWAYFYSVWIEEAL